MFFPAPFVSANFSFGSTDVTVATSGFDRGFSDGAYGSISNNSLITYFGTKVEITEIYSNDRDEENHLTLTCQSNSTATKILAALNDAYPDVGSGLVDDIAVYRFYLSDLSVVGNTITGVSPQPAARIWGATEDGNTYNLSWQNGA